MIIVSYFLLPIQVPPHLRLFCPLANSALTFGSAGSSWHSWVRNIMEKWLTWWFQGDYRFRENNLADGKGRRIPPGTAGAEQILNSVIINLPVFQHIFSCSAAEGERENGWRDVWDAPGASAAKMCVQNDVSSLCSTGCKQFLHRNSTLLGVLKGIDRLRGALQTWPEWHFFQVQTWERAAGMTTGPCLYYISANFAKSCRACPGCGGDRSFWPLHSSALRHSACPVWNTNDRN